MSAISLLLLLPLLTSSLRPPPPPLLDRSSPVPPEQWFSQVVDHDSVRDGRTWSQRYWLSKEHYRPGGPSILMIGGEGEASPHWLVAGTLVEYARQQGAALLVLEHRFYGRSRPVESTSVKNLSLLSSRQALADLANFISSMKTTSLPGPWVVVGGSYPGSLAGWLRLKYPHLVAGAVATSGPVAAKEDFVEYLEVVEAALDASTPGCSAALARAVADLTLLARDSSSYDKVTEMFQLCQPWRGVSVGILVEALVGHLETSVQYNRAGPGHNSSTDQLCDMLVDRNAGSELEQLAAINKRLMGSNTCLQADYGRLVSALRKTDFSDPVDRVPGDVGNRQWFYQTCTEFGWYQSSDQIDRRFGSTFPLGLFTKMCLDVFGPKFSPQLLRRGIEATLMEYGGRNLSSSVTNVVFVQGSLDPWHALGITTSTNALSPAILIPGTSHCANLYPETKGDPEQLKAARKEVGDLVAKWIAQAYRQIE